MKDKLKKQLVSIGIGAAIVLFSRLIDWPGALTPVAAVAGLLAELFTGLSCISLLIFLVRVVIPSYFIQRKLEKAREKARSAAGSSVAQPPNSIAVPLSSSEFKVEKIEEKREKPISSQEIPAQPHNSLRSKNQTATEAGPVFSILGIFVGGGNRVVFSAAGGNIHFALSKKDGPDGGYSLIEERALCPDQTVDDAAFKAALADCISDRYIISHLWREFAQARNGKLTCEYTYNFSAGSAVWSFPSIRTTWVCSFCEITKFLVGVTPALRIWENNGFTIKRISVGGGVHERDTGHEAINKHIYHSVTDLNEKLPLDYLEEQKELDGLWFNTLNFDHLEADLVKGKQSGTMIFSRQGAKFWLTSPEGAETIAAEMDDYYCGGGQNNVL